MNVDSRILAAVRLACEAHKDAKRKYSGKPYITHPLRVMGMVASHPNVGVDEVCAAVLHDVHEDPPYISLERIEKEHGAKVARYVKSLTNPSKTHRLSDGSYPKEWTRTKRLELNLKHLAECDYWEQSIKLYDRDDNLEELLHDIQGTSLRPPLDFVKMYCNESVSLAGTATKAESWQRTNLVRKINLIQSVIATMT